MTEVENRQSIEQTLNTRNWKWDSRLQSIRPFTLAAILGVYIIVRGIQEAHGAFLSGSSEGLAPGLALTLGGGFVTWVCVKMGGWRKTLLTPNFSLGDLGDLCKPRHHHKYTRDTLLALPVEDMSTISILETSKRKGSSYL